MCGVTTKDQVSEQDFLERMQLDDLVRVLHTHRLRRHGLVERNDGWLKKVQKLTPTGDCGRGRPKKTWAEVIDMSRLALGLRLTHLIGKLGVVDLKVQSDWTHPYTRDWLSPV